MAENVWKTLCHDKLLPGQYSCRVTHTPTLSVSFYISTCPEYIVYYWSGVTQRVE
jgi:hypothetical protein